METQSLPRSEPARLGTARWRITVYQILFGAMAVALGGFISAEPMLSLDRQADGRLECRYALNAYGRIAALEHSVDDLVRYEVTEGRMSGLRGTGSSGAGRASTSHDLTLWGRDGSSFSVGQSWSLTALDRMIEGGSAEPSHEQRVTAGRARRYGGWALGAFGLLLLSGAVWNGFLMVVGLRSPTERTGAA